MLAVIDVGCHTRHLQEPADVLPAYGCRCLYDTRPPSGLNGATARHDVRRNHTLIIITPPPGRRPDCARRCHWCMLAVIDAGCRRHLQEPADVARVWLPSGQYGATARHIVRHHIRLEVVPCRVCVVRVICFRSKL